MTLPSWVALHSMAHSFIELVEGIHMLIAVPLISTSFTCSWASLVAQ